MSCAVIQSRKIGAGDRAQTGGLRLGKATLYQLSYTRARLKEPTKDHELTTHVNSFMIQSISMKILFREKRNPVRKAQKMLLKWALIILLDVFCFALGISLGYRNYQANLTMADSSDPSYNQHNTEPLTSPKAPH